MNVISRSLTACGTSSSGRVDPGLRSWKHRTARWSLRMPAGSTGAKILERD